MLNRGTIGLVLVVPRFFLFGGYMKGTRNGRTYHNYLKRQESIDNYLDHLLGHGKTSNLSWQEKRELIDLNKKK